MHIICDIKQNRFILVTVFCIGFNTNRFLEMLHTGHSNKRIFEELDLFKFQPTGADKTTGKRLSWLIRRATQQN